MKHKNEKWKITNKFFFLKKKDNNNANKTMQKMQNAGISMDDLKNFDINKLKGML